MSDLEKMCDGCYRMVGDNEEMIGFQLGDAKGGVKVFKGHEECVKDIVETLRQLYLGETSE